MILYVILLVVLFVLPLPFIFMKLRKKKVKFVTYVVVYNLLFIGYQLVLALLCYLIYESIWKGLLTDELELSILAFTWTFIYFYAGVFYLSIAYLLIWLGISFYKKRVKQSTH